MRKIKAAHNDLIAAQIIFEKNPKELRALKIKEVQKNEVRRVTIEEVEEEIRRNSIE